MKSSPHH